MKDCCDHEIVPIARKLSIQTNRHPNTDGSKWGWIEGCEGNACWSDNKSFNCKRAKIFIEAYNGTFASLAADRKSEEV